MKAKDIVEMLLNERRIDFTVFPYSYQRLNRQGYRFKIHINRYIYEIYISNNTISFYDGIECYLHGKLEDVKFYSEFLLCLDTLAKKNNLREAL